jgi:hypothetical protein
MKSINTLLRFYKRELYCKLPEIEQTKDLFKNTNVRTISYKKKKLLPTNFELDKLHECIPLPDISK